MALDPAWVGVVGALSGVVVGALAEGIRARLSFQREKGWALEDERKQHLEDTYEALEQFREIYGLWYASALRTVATSEPSALKLPDRAVPWSHMQMLVHLYLPELKVHLKDIETTGPALGGAIADAPRKALPSAAHYAAATAPLDHAYNDLDTAVNVMRDKIVELSDASSARKAASAGR
jgi:hypothetical protein